ncbi:hypothetical protein BD309DRAFT_613700 [Dichomitus squalens]|nr:hypothetical protein BD309DRAFT_613700 [Dichomitus squalens]
MICIVYKCRWSHALTLCRSMWSFRCINRLSGVSVFVGIYARCAVVLVNLGVVNTYQCPESDELCENLLAYWQQGPTRHVYCHSRYSCQLRAACSEYDGGVID